MGTKDKTADAKAGVAGISGGTGLLGLAGLIPNEYHTIKAIATYASPAISIAITMAWIHCAAWLRQRFRKTQLTTALREARKMRDEVMADANASAQHKSTVQENVEAFERLAMEIISDDANLVRATLSGA